MTAMKDIHLTGIQPLTERRTPERPAQEERPEGAKFEQALQSAQAAPQPGQPAAVVPAPAAEPAPAASLQASSKALTESFERQHQQYRELMEVKQNLSRMFRSLTTDKADKPDE
ncbi:MAG TPA: hypothetical protein VL359_12180 [bacterium]|nr:hypothetical protein [bacterium]